MCLFFFMRQRPQRSTLFPYTTLFRSIPLTQRESDLLRFFAQHINKILKREEVLLNVWGKDDYFLGDRKSTRLNSSHVAISYAVFCLKKKKSEVAPYKKAQPSTILRAI